MIDVQSYRLRIGLHSPGPDRSRRRIFSERRPSHPLLLLLVISLLITPLISPPFLINTEDDLHHVRVTEELFLGCVRPNKYHLPYSRCFLHKIEDDQQLSTYDDRKTLISRKERNKMTHSLQGNRELILTHWNMGSSRLVSKIGDIRDYIYHNKPDVFGISESNFTADDSKGEVEVGGYTTILPPMYTDPVLGQARVIVYVRSSLTYKIRDDLMDSRVSSIWIEITAARGRKCLIGNTYREFRYLSSPGSETDTEVVKRWNITLDLWVKALREGKDCLHLGDLNMDFQHWDTPRREDKKFAEALDRRVAKLGVIQVVTQATRWGPRGDPATLDHIWLNCPGRTKAPSIGREAASDHLPVSIKYGKAENIPGHNTEVRRVLKDFHPEVFAARVRETDWSTLLRTDDVDIATMMFTDSLINMLSDIAPKKIIQQRKIKKPWRSEEVKEAEKERDALAEERRRGVVGKAEEYRRARNKTDRLKKKEKKNWEKEMFKKLEEDRTGRSLWQYFNKRRKGEGGGPPLALLKNGSLERRPEHLAKIQADFYEKKLRDIEESLKEAKRLSPHPLQTLKGLMAVWTGRDIPTRRLVLRPINMSKLVGMMSKWGSTNTEGDDGLSSYVLRSGGEALLPVILHLINLSITTGRFPRSWKKTIVKPLYKGKGSVSDPSSYRPIALIPAVSKLAEKVVVDQLTSFFEVTGQMNPEHHAYLKHRSTTTCLLSVTDRLSELREEGKVGALGIVDLSAAFDCVNHDVLVQKLELYGVQKEALNWFSSYLGQRTQVVEIGGKRSQEGQVRKGVPQGSILGPILFTLYVNELPAVCQTECGRCGGGRQDRRDTLFKEGCERCGAVSSYADDTTVVLGGDNPGELGDRIVDAVDKISSFLASSDLRVNGDKTHTMAVMVRQKRRFFNENEMSIVLGDKLITPSTNETVLGVRLSRDQSWKQHLISGRESVRGKIYQNLGQLWRLAGNCTTAQRLNLVNGAISSRLRYAACVWGGESSKTLSKLQVAQNSAARWALGAGRRSNISQNLTRCKWLSLHQNAANCSILQLWKTIRMTPHPYWMNRLGVSDSSGLRSTARGRVKVSSVRLDSVRTSWRWSAAVLWNKLPECTRCEMSFPKFKREVRSWVTSNIPVIKPPQLYNVA